MKANELRIGNLLEVGINVKLESIYSIVQEVNERIILIKDGNILRNMPLDVLKPIPLTEEWLLKFGFENFLNQYKIVTSINKGNYKNIPFIILYLDNHFQYDDLRFITNLQYVHQLQNLYFALTNEELTIKTK